MRNLSSVLKAKNLPFGEILAVLSDSVFSEARWTGPSHGSASPSWYWFFVFATFDIFHRSIFDSPCNAKIFFSRAREQIFVCRKDWRMVEVFVMSDSLRFCLATTTLVSTPAERTLYSSKNWSCLKQAIDLIFWTVPREPTVSMVRTSWVCILCPQDRLQAISRPFVGSSWSRIISNDTNSGSTPDAKTYWSLENIKTLESGEPVFHLARPQGTEHQPRVFWSSVKELPVLHRKKWLYQENLPRQLYYRREKRTTRS